MLLILEVPWATAPLTLVLGDLMFGIPARLRAVRQDAARRPSGLDPEPVLVRGICCLSSCFYPVMPSQYAFLNEVILLERSGAFRQFKRSRTLSRGFEGEFFMRWLGQLFLGTIFAFASG